MRKEELRIGNHTDIGEILALHQYVALVKGPEIQRFHDYREIEPIPLTDECLTRFGFETIDWKQDGELIETSISKDGVCLNGQYQLNEYTDTRSIKYVHQLQNLYFILTGKELR